MGNLNKLIRGLAAMLFVVTSSLSGREKSLCEPDLTAVSLNGTQVEHPDPK